MILIHESTNLAFTFPGGQFLTQYIFFCFRSYDILDFI